MLISHALCAPRLLDFFSEGQCFMSKEGVDGSLLVKQLTHSSTDSGIKTWNTILHVQDVVIWAHISSKLGIWRLLHFLVRFQLEPSMSAFFSDPASLNKNATQYTQCLSSCWFVFAQLSWFFYYHICDLKKNLSAKYFCYSMMSCLERLINILQNTFMFCSTDCLTLILIFFRLAVSKWFLFPIRSPHPP